MQRYRVNYGLLVGLVLGVIVFAGGAYALYKYQDSAKADRYLRRAEEAEQSGDIREAWMQLFRYTRYNKEDLAAREKLADTSAKLLTLDDVTMEDIGNAMSMMEQIVREQPDNTKLRRRHVDFLLSLGGSKEALPHINDLLNADPKNEELLAMKAQCLFAINDRTRFDYAASLIGFNPETGTFEKDKAKAPGAVDVYPRVAAELQGERRQPEQALTVINQMVDVNPESSKAHLRRGLWFMYTDKLEDAAKDLAKAVELDPKSADAKVATAQLLMNEKKYAEARELLLQIAKDHPEVPAAYQYLASLELTDKKYDEALAWLDKGVKATKGGAVQFLQFTKARLQLDRADREGAKESVDELARNKRFNPQQLAYLKARQLVIEEKWYEASQEFAKLQTGFSGSDLAEELNYLLGLCYEKIGQFEKAKECYELVVQANPENQLGKLGEMRINELLATSNAAGENQSIYAQLQKEIDKPEARQNWKFFDERVAAYAKANALDDATLGLLRAEVLMRRKMFAEARQQLTDIYKKNPKNLTVRRSAVRLVAADPEGGVAKALTMLDALEKDFGDLPILRLDRADMYLLANDKEVKNQLLALAKDFGDWDNSQKIQFWQGLATAFQRIRDNENASMCLEETTKLAPTDLASLMRRFALALEANDDVNMAEAQEQILEVVGSKENANWMFTEAQRISSLIQRGQLERSELKTVNDYLDRVIADRPKWNEPHLLRAQVYLAEGKVNEAVAEFDTAAGLGRSTAIAIYQHVKLLAALGRFNDAKKIAETVNAAARTALLGQEYAEILYNTGAIDLAREEADKVIAADPKNPAKQYWYGQFSMLASRNPKFSESVRKSLQEQGVKAIGEAIALDPSSQEMWLAYVGALATTGQRTAAENAVRGAQLALSEDESSLMLARCYEVMGRWFDAENLYKDTLKIGDERAPDDLRFKRFLAQFYLGPGYPRNDKEAKAVPLINAILRAGAENEKILPTDPHLQWARRTGAQMLAATKDYQNLLMAEKLLTSNVVNERLTEEDKLQLASILGSRPEPASRMKAIALLEESARNRELSAEAALQLGQLYFATNNWERTRLQMINTIGKYPDNAMVRATYISQLLQRGGPSDIDEATRQLKRMVELSPNSPGTMELVARVMTKAGRPQEAQKALGRLLPSDLNALTAENLPAVKYVANLLVELDQDAGAQKLFEAAAAKGGPTEQLELANFIGRRGDVAKAFEMIESLRDSTPVAARILTSLTILRARREEVGDKFDATVEAMIERALRDDPELLPVQMQQAEFYEIVGNSEKSGALYRQLLERDDLTGPSRAIVLNNLAYLLATTESSTAAMEEALKYVDEATQILGPVSDILDSRAVVLIQAKRYAEAIAALELAVTDNPTPSKWFHKALAHFRAGQNEGAQAAWKKAEELGLDRAELGAVEREQFDEMQAELAKLGLISAAK